MDSKIESKGNIENLFMFIAIFVLLVAYSIVEGTYE